MENEKENLLIGCACIVFDWMRSKNKRKRQIQVSKRQSKQKAEQLQKDNKSILQKLKKIRSSLEPLSFKR